MIKRSLTLSTAALAFWILASAQLVFAQTTKAEMGIQGLPTPATFSARDFAACKSASPAGAKYCDVVLDYAKAYSAYGKSMMAMREGQFRDQMSASGPIFTLVVGIVVIGLVLSVLQFLKGWLFATRVQGVADAFAPAKPGTSDSSGNLLSDEGESFKGFGFEVRSSVIGLIVLGMSLAFFFLYLKFVYAIYPLSQQ